MGKLISVIVTAYNIEDYISRCLDSLLGQSYGNLEIIVVDDGSSDATGRICDGYAEKTVISVWFTSRAIWALPRQETRELPLRQAII